MQSGNPRPSLLRKLSNRHFIENSPRFGDLLSKAWAVFLNKKVESQACRGFNSGKKPIMLALKAEESYNESMADHFRIKAILLSNHRLRILSERIPS